MAKEKEAAEVAKKPQPGGEDQGAKETILEEKKAEGGGGEAENVIRGFLRDRLFEFYQEVELAVESFEAWVRTQQQEFQTAFNQRGFYDFLGQRFLHEMREVVGGPGKPLMEGLVREIYNAISMAEHSSSNLSLFIHNALKRGTRDACWYVRDSAPYLCGDRWSDILQLAANGSDQFIPAVYQLGLPSRAFKPAAFSDKLRNHAEAYRRAMGLKREEVAEKQPQKEEKPEQKQKIEEQAQKDMAQEQDKKQATAT